MNRPEALLSATRDDLGPMATAPLDAIASILTALHERRPTRVLGASRGYRGLVLARAMLEPKQAGVAPLVYLAADEANAAVVAEDVAFFSGGGRLGGDSSGGENDILIVPEIDSSPYTDASADPRGVGLRLAAASRMRDAQPRMIILSLRSLRRMMIPAAAFASHRHHWAQGEEIERERSISALVECGYQRVDIVEDPGTFAVRGAVMDIFVPLSKFPARLEWFGDEIEAIRLFDSASQRSLREIPSVTVHPVRETIRTRKDSVRAAVLALGDSLEVPSSATRQVLENLQNGVNFFGIEALTPLFHERMVPLWEYLPSDARWYLDDPEALVGLVKSQEEDLNEQYRRCRQNNRLVALPEQFFLNGEQLVDRIRATPVIGDRLDLYEGEGKHDFRTPIRIELSTNLKIKTRLEASRANKSEQVLRPLVDELRALAATHEDLRGESISQEAWDVILVAPNFSHAERLTALLRGYGLVLEDPGDSDLEIPACDGGKDKTKTRIRVVAGRLSEGFCAAQDRLLVLAESDIYGARPRRRAGTRKRMGGATLAQLELGDTVVHLVHGVGRYQGLARLTLAGGVPADFMLVEYSGKDRLYLPVHRMGEVERYLAADGKKTKLDKMGGTTFAAKARKVRVDLRQLAEELLQIYAERASTIGHAHGEVGESYSSFEATFPFEETPDQAAAIDAVQRDLASPQPMDRLVCGDVGFGKTEVALRGAFRVAMGGHQVAVLAPTTVLVQQHFATFAERMSTFPLKVGCLNRFQSPLERRRVVEGIRDGTIDIVIGTHRLLSKDIRFRALGLVVIDEEQRFGVAQKERFKKLKTKVDVLALSATPIPRTLHMSLLGVREVSMITTPPVDRLAIRTLITRQGDEIVEEGVRKELARGGQVFYVVPRIIGIEEHARRIRELVPEARVLVAHGGVKAELLEKTMVDFVEYRADVLVATTIIESGLDIPRANTMFIARADQFGLAQLYQLRGRIGRSRRRAYCYMMVNSLEKIDIESRRRLEAIQRHATLGSGFNVASQDLEIRGAGDILGGRQSGNIQAMGFEAYARILGEAVAELRGDPIHRESDPELAFDIPAFLPDTYIEDTGQRLEFYRRLSSAADREQVRRLMSELVDRYGELSPEAENFGTMMVCKGYGRKLRATTLELARGRFSLRLNAETPLVSTRLVRMVREQTRLTMSGGDRIVVRLSVDETRSDRTRLLACEQALASLMSGACADATN